MSDAILNLDELFGQEQPVRVRWQGREYELKRPNAMKPEDFVKFSKLQAQFAALQADFTDDTAGQLETATAKLMDMLSPELKALQLPFMAQVRVLSFYTQQLSADAEKKAAPPAAAS